MIRRHLRVGLFAVVTLFSLMVGSAPAHAQFVVFDPSNFVENTLTAARELQQVTNEIQGLENQAVQLQNEADNLANLPYSSLADLDSSISQTQHLLQSAQNVSYDVSAIDQAFSQTYPQAYASSTSTQQLVADARTRWQNAMAGFQDAMHVQAGAVQNLSTTQADIGALISSSQSAVGALQAAQSGNQLIALETRQLGDLTSVMASIARAQSLQGASSLETQEQAQQQLGNFLSEGSGYQPQSVTMFH